MDGNEWIERRMRARRNGRYIGYIVLVGLGFVIFLGIAIMAMLAELGVVHDRSYPPDAKTIAIGLVALAICAVCVAAAVHFEHRLRGFPSGKLAAQLSEASAGVSALLGTGGYGRFGGYRRYGRYGRYRRQSPTSTLISGILIIVMCLLAVWATLGAKADASRSTATQHGTADAATVGTVNNYQQHNKGGTTYWATIDARLHTPVDGQVATVVHVPNNVNYQSGQVISVRVDPADPGYAELPGDPYTKGSTVIIIAILVALFAISGLALIARSFRMRARLSRLAPAGAGTSSAAAALAANSKYASAPEPGPGVTSPGPDHGGYQPGTGPAAAGPGNGER